MRGNPTSPAHRLDRGRSIPASAGEPPGPGRSRRPEWVYPRECGGTSIPALRHLRGQGLSPRVRGNHGVRFRPPFGHGSIPASAGEPPHQSGIGRRTQVYPRECGGTISPGPQLTPEAGLSPRVRGNHEEGAAADETPRSIPASAGEPPPARRRWASGRVYPRECGGTSFFRSMLVLPLGLSPRVRGNHVDEFPAQLLPGSIPASAGEPLEHNALIL